ncbi:MAG: oxidoreductase [Cryptosporangiaceae bacterium]|jgi:predicted DsbA family dithiol-disulfide isomerase|nr:oxidoreductase [Cryptosporangiaceae bacterium]
MRVEIWSDVVCPWCYIGKRRFEAALDQFPQRDQLEIEWKSFELDPGAESATTPAEAGDSGYAERLASKYGTTPRAAQQMLDQMTETAATVGLDFHFERAVHANTFDAHQVIHLGLERGVQNAVKERLLRAYFTEGALVGDRETLARLGAEAGLDADEVRTALDEQRYAAAVRADEADAARLGISGVPFFVVDRKYGVNGAQPAEQILELLQRAWSEAHPLTVIGTGDTGQACGPDGCPV